MVLYRSAGLDSGYRPKRPAFEEQADYWAMLLATCRTTKMLLPTPTAAELVGHRRAAPARCRLVVGQELAQDLCVQKLTPAAPLSDCSPASKLRDAPVLLLRDSDWSADFVI